MEEPRNRQFNMEDPETNRATGMALAVAFFIVMLLVAGVLGFVVLDLFD